MRYFYVKDPTDCGIINLKHCVTDDMIADFLTKPLQGKRFMKLRDIMLNNVPSDEHRTMLENDITG